ncbi:MAG: heme-binding protein [Paracoccaceae bacterium]|jgi:uncharacterized protein GlcG (DUF336 family)
MARSLIGAAALSLAAFGAQAQDAAIVGYQSLSPETAATLALAALEDCRARGAQIGISVTDRSGNLQYFIKDRYAGAHTVETSHRKAWTAASFRTLTSDLSAATSPDSEAYGIRALTLALPLGGGVPIYAGDGALLGAIGVSGAPSPQMDEDCANAGLDAIEMDIAF